MKIGILKSNVDKFLTESYSKGTFKNEVINFNKLVLTKKNVAKLFYIYDDLKTNKGLNESIATEYLNETIFSFESTLKKVKQSDLEKIKKWVGKTNSINSYSEVDYLLYPTLSKLEEKIESKKIIIETLKQSPVVENKELINLPMQTMVNVANRTISNYIDNLNESEKDELFKFLSMDNSELNNQFKTLKENIKTKLSVLNESSDEETNKKINETLKMVESEKCELINFFKLKNLNDSL